jgi:hypothetical protein
MFEIVNRSNRRCPSCGCFRGQYHNPRCSEIRREKELIYFTVKAERAIKNET